ncbi:hypothetical protein GOBAR_AA27228 [Gossypium barbadense]|uniref:DUF4283 domain-containing protein n=1 Tax=Gossypium barbadense TaxID=3634 RepID=A0A2P5WQW5_GOSBA|nr:hypothetical protein GOBAR_AA27228 [Gossypium barbadense]
MGLLMTKYIVCNDALVGWCKNFIKIEDLKMNMSEAGLVGFSIVRISGTIVLMVFESEEKMKQVVLEEGWWGEFISINEETQEPMSFMRGNIQLNTDCFNGIDEVIDLQVGGKCIGMEKRASDINTKLNVDMGICETTYDCENSDGVVGEKILNEGNGNQEDIMNGLVGIGNEIGFGCDVP